MIGYGGKKNRYRPLQCRLLTHTETSSLEIHIAVVCWHFISLSIMISSVRLFSILALQTVFFVAIFGYKIDQSCTKEGIEIDVRNAMTSAFEMVDAALNRMTAHPLDPNTIDLVAKLFARPGQDPTTAITAKTVDVLARIRQYYCNEVPRRDVVGDEDIASARLLTLKLC
jgi:hypothetical protein